MTSHLDALRLRLSNESIRLAAAKTQGERDLRTVWIAQIKREIQEEVFTDTEIEMSDDELLAALTER